MFAGGADLVASDLADIPRVMATIRDDWNTPLSLNRQSAEAFFNHIYE